MPQQDQVTDDRETLLHSISRLSYETPWVATAIAIPLALSTSLLSVVSDTSLMPSWVGSGARYLPSIATLWGILSVSSVLLMLWLIGFGLYFAFLNRTDQIHAACAVFDHFAKQLPEDSRPQSNSVLAWVKAMTDHGLITGWLSDLFIENETKLYLIQESGTPKLKVKRGARLPAVLPF